MRRFSSFAFVALTLLAIAFSSTGLRAAVQGQDMTPPSFMTDIFENAGLIGVMIMVLSVVALALGIEHFMTLKRDKLAPPHLIDEIEALFEEGKFQEAVDVCEAESNYLTDIVGAGLAKLGHSFETIQTAFEEMHEERDVQLHAKVGWLSLIGAIAPMMGLLGTVKGMMVTFGEIASKPSVKPTDLAGGIKAALVTTLLGLTVAIPVTAIFVFFKNRVTLMSIEIGAIVEDLFERFRTRPDTAGK